MLNANNQKNIENRLEKIEKYIEILKKEKLLKQKAFLDLKIEFSKMDKGLMKKLHKNENKSLKKEIKNLNNDNLN